jgi:hypothetical protein
MSSLKHCKLISFFTGSTATLGPGLCFQFHNHFTDGKVPWTSDQLVARPLPNRTTQTQNKHINAPNIHALCGIWTHDPGFRESEDSSCCRLIVLSFVLHGWSCTFLLPNNWLKTLPKSLSNERSFSFLNNFEFTQIILSCEQSRRCIDMLSVYIYPIHFPDVI